MIFEAVGEFVAEVDRNISIDDCVQIHMIHHATLSDQAFLGSQYSVHFQGYQPDFGDELLMCIFIHHFPQSRTKNPECIVNDNSGSYQCRPIIRSLITFPHHHCDRYAHKCSQGCNRVTPVMPGVRFKNPTLSFPAFPFYDMVEALLDQDDDTEDNENVSFGIFMRVSDIVQTL